MLRQARALLLLAVLAIAGFVAYTYVKQRAHLRRTAAKAGPTLPPNTAATAEGWSWTKTTGECTDVEVKARTFQQVREPSSFQLEGLEMKVFRSCGKTYDLIKSERASFDTADGLLYSEGEVEITMGIPLEGAKAGRIIGIRSSGVSFDSKNQRVTTDRKATFQFDQGEGEAIGASYDSITKELIMRSNVRLNWYGGAGDKKRPMLVETGHLTYRESASEIFLSPWAKLLRANTVLEAADSVVILKDGAIERVEAKSARGSDKYPARELNYNADFLTMHFTPKGEVRQLIAAGKARLESKAATAITEATAERFDLDFDTSTGESALTKVLANGAARIDAQPVERAGTPQQGKRILTSEVIELKMRGGGEEVQEIVTHTPGHLEILAAKPGGRQRILDAERMTMLYGKANQMESFRGVNVKTRTESLRGKTKTVAITTSRDMQADFDPKSGELAQIEQWPDFVYEEGDRHAKAARATLVSAKDLITLKDDARFWDSTGSTSGDQIVLDQKTGNLTATGNVSSTRIPSEKTSTTGMLSGDAPLQARAQRMTVTDDNKRIVYEGDAVLWQGSNRLQAKRIEIDRAGNRLHASENVVSQLADQSQPGTRARPSFSIIRAADLVYTDDDKVALYTGGTHLERPALDVKARQMKAWFVETKTDKKSETRLDRMFADGSVEILAKAADRERRASSEHAEYYLGDERIILNGGNPVLSDSKRGVTRGREITWYPKQDRLIVDNSGAGQGVTRINKKSE